MGILIFYMKTNLIGPSACALVGSGLSKHGISLGLTPITAKECLEKDLLQEQNTSYQGCSPFESNWENSQASLVFGLLKHDHIDLILNRKFIYIFHNLGSSHK